MIFTALFLPNPDEKYSGTSLPTSQNGSNIQDDEVTSVHRCTLSIFSKAQIQVKRCQSKYLIAQPQFTYLKRCMACSNIFEIAPDSHVRLAGGIISEP